MAQHLQKVMGRDYVHPELVLNCVNSLPHNTSQCREYMDMPKAAEGIKAVIIELIKDSWALPKSESTSAVSTGMGTITDDILRAGVGKTGNIPILEEV